MNDAPQSWPCELCAHPSVPRVHDGCVDRIAARGPAVNETAVCVRCRRILWTTELEAGRWACERCEIDTAQKLRALPAVFKRVNQLAALMKGSTTGGIGSPNREAPAPLKIGVLNLTAKGGVVTELQAIEDAWRQTLGWSMGSTRHHADIDGVTTFLTNNLRWACERYEEVADDLKKISSLHGQLSGIDTGVRAPKRFAVYCDTADCGGSMKVTLFTERAACHDCGTEFSKVELGHLDSEYGPNPNRIGEAA
ncbi:hypothetical protein [Streptomyces sp900116325]|uniref:hypothetical protein n=1 Tax=Streptomyces sp. 900116325 TaxID=3154295 RepID=UPI0033B5E40F